MQVSLCITILNMLTGESSLGYIVTYAGGGGGIPERVLVAGPGCPFAFNNLDSPNKPEQISQNRQYNSYMGNF
mgnify:CR=1 FL=1